MAKIYLQILYNIKTYLAISIAWGSIRDISVIFSHTYPCSKRDTFTQCWVNGGPRAQSAGQHYPNIGPTSLVCWVVQEEGIDPASYLCGFHNHVFRNELSDWQLSVTWCGGHCHNKYVTWRFLRGYGTPEVLNTKKPSPGTSYWRGVTRTNRTRTARIPRSCSNAGPASMTLARHSESFLLLISRCGGRWRDVTDSTLHQNYDWRS